MGRSPTPILPLHCSEDLFATIGLSSYCASLFLLHCQDQSSSCFPLLLDYKARGRCVPHSSTNPLQTASLTTVPSYNSPSQRLSMPPPSSAPYIPPGVLAARRARSPARVVAEAEEQWLFTEEELAHTPSIQDGMPPEKERDLRAKGINFIRQVGVMLKLPELTLSTAAIFFHRFLMRMSLVDRPGLKALHHYVSRCYRRMGARTFELT